jgi:hypothetical protein
MLSRKIKTKMEGHPPKGCITGPGNTKMEMSWKYRRMGVPFEGDQGPDGAATPYMDDRIKIFLHIPSRHAGGSRGIAPLIS